MNNLNQMMGIPQQRTNQFTSYFNPVSGANASTNNIVWVQGIEGAKAWQLNPNSMVILLDSEIEGKMYIKVSDNIGMSSLRIFSYVEELPTTNNVTTNNNLDLSEYVKKDELGILLKEILNEQTISTTATEVATTATPTTNAVIQQPKIVTVKK
jgi:hypothetical protein